MFVEWTHIIIEGKEAWGCASLGLSVIPHPAHDGHYCFMVYPETFIRGLFSTVEETKTAAVDYVWRHFGLEDRLGYMCVRQ